MIDCSLPIPSALTEITPKSLGLDAQSSGGSLDEGPNGQSFPERPDSPIREAKPSNNNIAVSEKTAGTTKTFLDDSWHNGKLDLSSKKEKAKKAIFANDL